MAFLIPRWSINQTSLMATTIKKGYQNLPSEYWLEAVLVRVVLLLFDESPGSGSLTNDVGGGFPWKQRRTLWHFLNMFPRHELWTQRVWSSTQMSTVLIQYCCWWLTMQQPAQVNRCHASTGLVQSCLLATFMSPFPIVFSWLQNQGL